MKSVTSILFAVPIYIMLTVVANFGECNAKILVLSRLPLTQFGEIGSGNPTNVFGGNRLLLPILRQKMSLTGVWCLLTRRMVVRWFCRDQNAWNTIPGSRQKITLSKRLIEHWRLNCDHPVFATVKYLCDYGTNNCNPNCPDVCYEALNVMLSVFLLFKRAHL